VRDFQTSYGRPSWLNHEVMMRGTFANIRIKKPKWLDWRRGGGYTKGPGLATDSICLIAAMGASGKTGTPLVIFGRAYRRRSSR